MHVLDISPRETAFLASRPCRLKKEYFTLNTSFFFLLQLLSITKYDCKTYYSIMGLLTILRNARAPTFLDPRRKTVAEKGARARVIARHGEQPDITRIIRANKRVMTGFRRCRGRREAYNVATTIRIACNRVPPPPPPRTERALKRTQTREIPQNSTTMKRGNTEDKRVSTKSWNSIAKMCSSRSTSKIERVILPRASLSLLFFSIQLEWSQKSRSRIFVFFRFLV